MNDAIYNTRRSFPTKNDNIKEFSFGINIGSINYSNDQSNFDARIPDPLLYANSSGTRYFTIDAGAAYVSAHLSAQFSVKNINMNSTQGNTANGDVNINRMKFKHYLASLQYEIYFNNGWNLEPSFLIQFLEKTEESSLDMNLKVYRLVKKSRIWLGASFRQNFVEIDTPSETKIPKQNYTHFTPVFGMNYNRYFYAYHYTSNLGIFNLGTLGLHYFSIGISFF